MHSCVGISQLRQLNIIHLVEDTCRFFFFFLVVKWYSLGQNSTSSWSLRWVDWLWPKSAFPEVLQLCGAEVLKAFWVPILDIWLYFSSFVNSIGSRVYFRTKKQKILLDLRPFHVLRWAQAEPSHSGELSCTQRLPQLQRLCAAQANGSVHLL